MKKNKEGHAYRHCMRDVQCCLYDVQRWTTLTPERWHPWLHDYRWWTVLVWYGVRGDWRKITWREKRFWRKIEKRKQGNGEEGSQTLKKGKREWLGGRGGGGEVLEILPLPVDHCEIRFFFLPLDIVHYKFGSVWWSFEHNIFTPNFFSLFLSSLNIFYSL